MNRVPWRSLKDSLVNGLPDSLPLDPPQYTGFRSDPEKTAEFGNEGSALNHALEVALAPYGCVHGINLCGRGSSLGCIVCALEKQLSVTPDDARLGKWVDDLTVAAKNAGAMCTLVGNSTSYTIHSPA